LRDPVGRLEGLEGGEETILIRGTMRWYMKAKSALKGGLIIEYDIQKSRTKLVRFRGDL
jgi:hypothetical protein